MYVTINQLKEWNACEDGFERFMSGAGKDAKPDEKVSLYDALDKGCVVSDITWAISNIDLTPAQERDIRLLACDFARRVLPIFEKENPEDKRPREAIDTAERFANGDATKEELDAARAAAWAAAGDAARDAARAAGDAAWAAGDAAGDAARAAAWAAGDAARAAGDAARAAAWAAGDAARDAAWAAARDAARAAGDAARAAGDAARAAGDAEEQAQKEILLEMLSKYK